jgi:lipid-A-disaccharide synthase
MSIGKIFISAGELSGDLHGGKLIAALKNLNPDISVSAIGGDNMANAGAQLLFHIRETSFMGFTEVVKHLRSSRISSGAPAILLTHFNPTWSY